MSKSKGLMRFSFLVLLTFCFAIVTYGFFIYKTVYQEVGGPALFSLFDDGMISMKYAKNLISGHGLVWNPGERVEGITNLLWTLFMAFVIWIFGLTWAPLVIQIFGGAFLLVSTLIVFKKLNPQISSEIAKLFLLISCLFYYPAYYWSLVGMEVSLLILILAVTVSVFVCDKKSIDEKLLVVGISSAISYVVRPDGPVVYVPLLIFLIFTKKLSLKRICIGILPIVFVVFFIGIWRWSYYGELVPTTYTLKVSGYSLISRLKNGMNFVIPFLAQTSGYWLIGLGYAVYAWKRRNPKIAIMFLSSLVVLCYQIYVGGDPWDLWRQLVPSIFILTVVIAFLLDELMTNILPRRLLKLGVLLVVTFWLILVPNYPFRDEIFAGSPYQYEPQKRLIRTADILNKVISKDGSILVFWAGVLPYYFNGLSIDALGKTDKYIANLSPDFNVSWNRMNGVPGHSKYDLEYSIDRLRPDYIQAYKWGSQNYSKYVQDHYVLVEIEGKKFCFLNKSKNIKWSLLKVLGQCEGHVDL